jgi:hypothetical protein
VDFIRLLSSFEDLVSEIVVWALMLPKTLWQAIVRPEWIHGYIDEELAKPPDKRFNEHFAPILFWLIVGIGPNIFFQVGDPKTGQLLRFGLVNTSFQIASLIIALTFPLVFIWVLNRAKKQPIEKEGLKRLLMSQCYLTAPVMLIETFASTLLFGFISDLSNTTFLVVGSILMLAALIWTIIRETGMFAQELGITRSKSLGSVIGACLLRIPVSLAVSAMAVEIVSATTQ